MRISSPRMRRLAAAGVLACGLAVTADRARTQPPGPNPAPAPEPTLVPANAPDYGNRPVAYIYGNVPVTRAHLAEFLIARGGYEKVELLVNRMIIEEEAKKRGITVTPQEMEAALADDLKGINVDKKDFVNVVLPKYGKSLYEWMEDVVRPRLLLTKMCKDRVEVTDEDLRLEFERNYGEKRAVRIIIWPATDDLRSVTKLWDVIRKSDEEFLRVAKQQANPSLAAVAGEIKPINKHLRAEDQIVEKAAFALREEGEVSEILKTQQGYMVMKLLKIIPPDTKVDFEQVKDQLYNEVFDFKLSAEIPKQFAELREIAAPNILLKGPPSQWQFQQTNRQMAEEVFRQQMGEGVTPAGASMPAPMPPKK
jgi:hypothetical protein